MTGSRSAPNSVSARLRACCCAGSGIDYLDLVVLPAFLAVLGVGGRVERMDDQARPGDPHRRDLALPTILDLDGLPDEPGDRLVALPAARSPVRLRGFEPGQAGVLLGVGTARRQSTGPACPEQDGDPLPG